MEIGLNTLLVALMFVTILSMGIGNILMTLSGILSRPAAAGRSRVHVAWIVLVLIVHFNLFWNTATILEVETWRFPGFLLTLLGPVLLLFATNVLLTDPDPEDGAEPDTFYLSVGRRFFLLFAGVQLWVVVADFLMAGVFNGYDIVNIITMGVALGLAYAKDVRIHNLGLLLALCLILCGLLLQWI